MNDGLLEDTLSAQSMGFPSINSLLREEDATIIEILEGHARTAPPKAAIVTDDETVSYGELNRRANRIAHHLIRNSHEGPAIAVLEDQGINMIAAALGVLKSAKAYCPLDPFDPPERLAHIVDDLDAGLILTSKRHQGHANAIAGSGRLVLVIDDILRVTDDTDPCLGYSPDTLAYIIYTSGSTGRPKGICQTHQNLLHYARTYSKNLAITNKDRLTWFYSPAFSASIPDVYSALFNGATLFPYAIRVLGVSGLAHWLVENKITVFHSVPTVFRHFSDSLTGPDNLPDLRVIDLGGEPVHALDIAKFQKYFSKHTVIYNHYAAAEASVIAQYRITQADEVRAGVLPVGSGADGMSLEVRDTQGKKCAPEEEGEIYIRSKYLARGYWRRPDLTEAAFQEDSGDKDRRIYRTGDVGRVLPDGNIMHLGRKDDRIKVRGYSVELGEIECALASLDSVKEAVAGSWLDKRGDRHLVAYLVPDGDLTLDPSAVRKAVSNILPQHMIPARIFQVKALPLLPSGKVDRRRLCDSEQFQHDQVTTVNPPQTKTERILLRLWEIELEREISDMNSDFLSLGGDSIKAVALCLRMSEVFNRDIALQDLYEAPSIALLAKRVEALILGGVNTERVNRASEKCLVVLQPYGEKPPLFLVPGGHGSIHTVFGHYSLIARQLDAEQPMYAFVARGTAGDDSPHKSIEEMAAAYIEEMRQRQPKGPFLLIGECLGGSVVFEMAQQLRASNENVPALFLLDTPYPGTLPHAMTHRTKRVVRKFSRLRKAVKKRIKHHAQQLKRITIRQTISYVFNRALLIPKLLRSDVPYPVSSRSEANAMHQAIGNYRMLSTNYRPSPYDGRVVLLVSDTWRGQEKILRWKEAVCGDIEIYDVPGEHDNYMFVSPDRIAQIITTCLSRIEF